jgi:hypothetical protein
MNPGKFPIHEFPMLARSLRNASPKPTRHGRLPRIEGRAMLPDTEACEHDSDCPTYAICSWVLSLPAVSILYGIDVRNRDVRNFQLD